MSGSYELTRSDFLKKLPVLFLKGVQPFSQNENPSVEGTEVRKILRFDIHKCLAWGQMECQYCYLACHLREKAIQMRDHKPVIVASECDSCGVCVEACQTVNTTPALKMVSV